MVGFLSNTMHKQTNGLPRLKRLRTTRLASQLLLNKKNLAVIQMTACKVYAWELPQSHPRAWDREEQEGGLQAWNNDSSESEEEEAKPGEELASYLLEQHRMGSLNAKQVCVIAHWGSQAGVAELRPLSLPPDAKGSGDFKRRLDQLAPASSCKTYVVECPAYVRAAGGRATFGLHVLLPHELLLQDLENANMQELHAQWKAAPNYQNHPVVAAAEAMADPPPVVPLSLFVDGVSYTKRDSLLAVTIHNLWTGHRFVLAVLRRKILCRCSCRGWETLQSFFAWLEWCLQVLKAGLHPAQKHNQQPWNQDTDKQRADRAGTRLPFLGAVVQLRADWAEIAHILSVPQWSSARHPCFLCSADRDSVYALLEECSGDHWPWPLKSADDFELACQECEVTVANPPRQLWHQAQRVLEHDMRSDGARGLSLRASIPGLNLQAGDRVEPTPSQPDTQAAAAQDLPEAILFWRRRNESLVLRRNPLLKPDLGMDLPSVVALDLLHTFCLGIHQQFVAHAMWACIRQRNAPGLPMLQAARDEENMQHLKAHYQAWLRAAKGRFLITAVPDMGLDILGSPGSPSLRAKAHESLTLLRWLRDFLPTMQQQLDSGDTWVLACRSLVEMWEAMANGEMQLPDGTQQDAPRGPKQSHTLPQAHWN